MANNVQIDIEGTLFDGVKRTPRFEKGLEEGIKQVAIDVDKDTKEKLEKGRGFWKGSLYRSISFSPIVGLGFEVASNPGGRPIKHAEYVEWGRRPGKWPPRQAIAEWARTHGFTTPGSLYLLQRAIGRRGVKGVHMFRDTAKEWNAKKREISRIVGKEVVRELRRS